MEIAETNTQNTVIARTVPVGAVFEHQGVFHMRISDPDEECRHVSAVELATGQYVLIPNVIDVRLRPDVHMVTGFPASDASDAGRTTGPLLDPDDVINVNGVDYYRQE